MIPVENRESKAQEGPVDIVEKINIHVMRTCTHIFPKKKKKSKLHIFSIVI